MAQGLQITTGNHDTDRVHSVGLAFQGDSPQQSLADLIELSAVGIVDFDAHRRRLVKLREVGQTTRPLFVGNIFKLHRTHPRGSMPLAVLCFGMGAHDAPHTFKMRAMGTALDGWGPRTLARTMPTAHRRCSPPGDAIRFIALESPASSVSPALTGLNGNTPRSTQSTLGSPEANIGRHERCRSFGSARPGFSSVITITDRPGVSLRAMDTPTRYNEADSGRCRPFQRGPSE